MSDSLDLFANAKTNLDSLKVNKNYAERFERNKRREEIQRAKQKAKELGVDFDDLDAEQESESESEDSDGELITKKVNTKFLKALAMIKNRDPRLKDSNFTLFSDSDFETSSEGSGKEKPVYYKDLQRQTILEAAQEEEDEPKSKRSKKDKKGETPVEEQKRLKNEFISASKSWESGGMNDLLVPRHKTQEEIQQEEDEFQRFVKRRTELDPKADLNEIKDYWDRVQNEDDRFLKKFVLNQAWQENQELMTYDEIVDQEDEKRDKEIENFETAFNFRFEEEGFEKIKTYSRNIPESVRRKDDTRKKQRETKKERKELEKKQKVEEIKRIKNLKKQEIEDRLNMINHYAGVNTSLNDKYLEEEFDPAKHEQLMEKIFDDEYYEEADENVEIDSEYKAHNDENTNTIDIEKIETAAEEPIGIREGAPGDWWVCDGCGNGIMEGKWRFDCTECENFTLCDVCRTQVVHEHRLKKLKVPIGCRPPSDIVHILCDICGEDITTKDRFDCTQCSDFSVCEVCKPNATHEHPLKAASEALWNELYNLDYEDMIGDVPCRFKYRKVDPEDYGLDDKDILTWDDSMLNQYISLKKIAPYKEDPKLSRKKLKRKYNYFKLQMKQKRKEEKSKKTPEVNARLNSYGINE